MRLDQTPNPFSTEIDITVSDHVTSYGLQFSALDDIFLPIAGLSDGEIIVSATPTGKFNRVGEMGVYPITLDTTPPQVELTAPEYANSGFVVDASSSDLNGISLEELTADGNPIPPGVYLPAVEGMILFEYVAMDHAGNVSTATQETIYDITPPEIDFELPEVVTEAIIDVNPEFRDALSGIGETQLEYRFEGGFWQEIALGELNLDDLDGLGDYEFRASAVDRAGNQHAVIQGLLYGSGVTSWRAF
jgi:hypothetical protein